MSQPVRHTPARRCASAHGATTGLDLPEPPLSAGLLPRLPAAAGVHHAVTRRSRTASLSGSFESWQEECVWQQHAFQTFDEAHARIIRGLAPPGTTMGGHTAPWATGVPIQYLGPTSNPGGLISGEHYNPRECGQRIVHQTRASGQYATPTLIDVWSSRVESTMEMGLGDFIDPAHQGGHTHGRVLETENCNVRWKAELRISCRRS